MGTVNIGIGDNVVVQRNGREYKFEVEWRDDEGGVTFTQGISCEACGENDASDYEFEGHYLCPRCIQNAMEIHVYERALNHIIESDDALAKVYQVMDYFDARNARQNHTDFHSASIDHVWCMDDTELAHKFRAINDAVENVIAIKVLLAQ